MAGAATISEQIQNLSNQVAGFFNGTTKKLEETQELLKAAEAGRAKAIEDLSALQGTVTAKDREIEKLGAELKKAQDAAAAAEQRTTAAEEKAKQTEASVEQRAGNKALAIEQKRGAKAPVKEEANAGSDPAGGDGKTLLEQYNALADSDPKAAAVFWDEHAEAIKQGK